MTWPGARKDAETFALALEGRGSPDGDLQELVRLAASLRETAAEPAPEFLVDLRSHLMAEASAVLVPRAGSRRPTPPRRARKRLAAAAIGVITVAGTLGIVTTSAQALPGDTLYPVKRGVESVQLSLHRSHASRGAFELSQASERLAEAQELATADARRDSAVAASLTDFAAKATAGSQALFEDFSNAGDRASINKVVVFATDSNSALASLTATLPKSAAAAFGIATATVNNLVRQASALCDECQRAEIANLAAKVQSIVSSTAKHSAVSPAHPRVSKIAVPVTTPAPPKVSKIAVPRATTTPIPQVPALTTTPPPSPTAAPTIDVGQATKPIVGVVLGDADHPGLVPGLLGGLLSVGG